EMALAGIYREREIRIVMVGADPCPVQSDFRGNAASDATHGPNVLDHIDQRLAGFRLPYGVRGVVVLHVEVHVLGTTGCLSGGDGGRILGKGGHCEQDESESDAHNSSLN